MFEGLIKYEGQKFEDIEALVKNDNTIILEECKTTKKAKEPHSAFPEDP